MSIFKRVPWVSVVLVLLSYSTLGWVVSETKPPQFVWLVLIFGILLLVGSLTIPWSKMTDFSVFLFKSNTRTFIFAISASFLFFLMIAWFRVFLDTLLIISAAILARIDFQAAGLQEGQAFWITSIFSLTGLALGAGMQMVFVRHLW
jgi:glucose-6-phosphate-specific signal transduction histidine kinase